MMGERPPRMEEAWTILLPDNNKRVIFIEPGSRGDEAYLLEQLRSLAGQYRIPGDELRLAYAPPVPR